MAFLEFALPSIRGDYQIFETYDMNNMNNCGPNRVTCPITALYAGNDVAIDAMKMCGWADRTTQTASFRLEAMPGDHFYLTHAAHKSTFESFIKTEVLTVLKTKDMSTHCDEVGGSVESKLICGLKELLVM